jgi:type III secretion protein V
MLELADDLSVLAEDGSGAWVRGGLEAVRETLYLELGVRPPGIRVCGHVKRLTPGSYRFCLDEVPLIEGQVQVDGVFARSTPEDLAYLSVEGTGFVDPGGQGSLTQVHPSMRERLETAGVTVLAPLELLAQHIAHALRASASLLLGLQDVRALVDAFEPQFPALVQETLQKVPLPLLTEVLRQLLAEEVSIRDLRAVFEALASPGTEGDAAALVERCREALHRYLSYKYAPVGPLFAYLTDPSVEETLRSGPGLSLDPAKVEAILCAMRRIALEGNAVVLTSPDIRRTLRKLSEGSAPQVAVLTYRELDPRLQIRPLGRLAAG